MRIYKGIEIPEDDPFINDKFHREEFINNLMSVLHTYDSGLVLSIDSSWGTGKTTFIKMWETHLKNDADFKPIYFNAWENDDSLDPLVPLISLMSDELISENGTKFKDSKLFKIGSKIIKKGVPSLLKTATHGLLDLSEISIGKDTEKEIEGFSTKIGETIFDDYKEKSSLKKQFKKALMEYQQSINKKVIIFIDELDRCRPLYAIETLERIKHFFDLDNFIFILAMDKTQLSHSVSTIYGNNMDSIGYLRRFIDLEFTLPEPNLDVYINYLISEYNFTFINIDYFWNLLKSISKSKNTSLRNLDKLFINLKILLPLVDIFNNDKKTFTESYICLVSNIYIFFMLIKMLEPDSYKIILERKYSTEDIRNLVNLIEINKQHFEINNYNGDLMHPFYINTISKFLLIHLADVNNLSLQSDRNSQKYIIEFNVDPYTDIPRKINLLCLWNSKNQCSIINNFMFTNNVKI
ncbi:MAG TPA: P-loop NTPase fold protein [Clostridium sp.]|uniref:KAP family P-loop NTPase fold protein n=1 Tax=Clostridium sp. TaxID=1506 RepID=UPI002F92837D